MQNGKLDLATANSNANTVNLLLNQSIAATRRISYTYDGLARLTSAAESDGTTYGYAYDLAGNRTSVTVNGTTTNFNYNAANQVISYAYDAAGNLTNDGTTTYSYDALKRMTGRGTTTYAYNGDGTLISQTANSVTTRYTQDLASC